MFGTKSYRSLATAAKQATANATSTIRVVPSVVHKSSALHIGGYESEAVRPKLFIPGPIEFSPEVLKAMSAGARGHTDPTLIEDFGFSIEMVRKVFLSETAQPFILSGSGATGWDAVACNLLDYGDKALVVASGHFSDRFTDCLVQYGVKVTQINPAKPGMRPSNAEVEKKLKEAASSGSPFKVITITGVDTSTAVLADLKNICDIVKATSPETLVVVDAVCSAAGEELRMDEWGVDFVLTGSQKAFGVPPGLSIMIASQKAMSRIPEKEKIRNYFVNLPRWLPIMKAYEARTPSYFATPACNTVGALRVGLEQMLSTPGGMDGYFKAHVDNKDMVPHYQGHGSGAPH
jgi:alanine-glyoxylate transaminase/serine-glyoxylate transaminase/serine-pyruvate transaminase